MILFDEIIEVFRKTIETADSGRKNSPAVLSDPSRLYRIAVVGEQRRRDNEWKLGMPVPRFCIFSLTRPSEEIHDGCSRNNFRSGGSLSIEDIRRTVSEASGMGTYIFIITGCGSFMLPALLPALKSIEDALFFVITNGPLAGPFFLQAIREAGNILPIDGTGGSLGLRKEYGAGVAKRKCEARPFPLNFPSGECRGSGCLAAETEIIHVNADGFVEPCPFCRYAADTIKDKSLEEALSSDFFASLRKTFGNMGNPDRGCLLSENGALVEAIAGETGAFSTEPLMVRSLQAGLV
jgi:hypothetical protein